MTSEPLSPTSPTSSQALRFIVPLLRDISRLKQLDLSSPADTAVKISVEVQNVKTNTTEFEQIAADVCLLVFVIADQLREKGQKTVEGETKKHVQDIATIYEEILELVQSNSAKSPFSAFWHSDHDNLEILNTKLTESLQKFDIQSLSDLRTEANNRIGALGGYPPKASTTNTASDQSHINNNMNQNDNGMMNSRNQYGPQMFSHASGFNIQGGEFNNIGGNLNRTTYHAKNVAANYGRLYGQNVGDGTTVNFQGLSR